MSLKALRKFSFVATGILGLVGGTVAWTVGEPVRYYTKAVLTAVPALGMLVGGSPEILYAASLGLYLGIFLGAVEGVLGGNSRTLARGMLFGGVAGLVGGALGTALGEIAFHALGSFVGRPLGWAAFGALLGVAPGLVMKAADRAARGLMGGAVGGFAGGFVFAGVAGLFAQEIIGRGVAIPLLGATLGACYGLAETMLRRAWLTVLSGPSEGYEFALGGRAVTIGSGARADLRLQTDPPLPGLALELTPQGDRFRIKKLDLDQATVNQQALDDAVLSDGDVIRVRGVRILFSQRDASAREAQPQKLHAPPPPSMPSQRPVDAGSAPGVKLRRSLEGLSGPVQGRTFKIDAERVSIGRDDSNDIVIDDLSVSLRHAELQKRGKFYVVFDLSSSNGTFVQGRRVAENALKNGFALDIGQVKLKFVEEPE